MREKVRSYNSAGLPLHGDATTDFDMDAVRVRDLKEKRDAKVRDDANRHAKQTSLKVGDYVVIKAMQPAKGLAKFDSKPWKVSAENNGDLELVDENGVTTKRNVTLVKKVTWGVNSKLCAIGQKSKKSTRTRSKPKYLKDYVHEIRNFQA